MASIEFVFNNHNGTRAVTDEATLRQEEGNVDDLIYGIFQDGICRRMEHIVLKGSATGSLHTGTSPKQCYTVQNIPIHWLNAQTEIFAVANADATLQQHLMNGTYTITDDNTFLRQKVNNQIDSLARSKVYDLLIQNRYQGEAVPTDSNVHYLPANERHIFKKKWKLEAKYRFKNYKEFCEKKQMYALEPTISNIYQEITIDLQCRLKLYQTNNYNKEKDKLQKEENTNHNIRNYWKADKGFQQYLLWRSTEHTTDLNEAARQSHTAQQTEPLMAGYFALKDDYPSEIRVPVEHAYSRIWFTFQWDGLQEANSITVDSITLNGLLNKTKLFNIEEDRIQNNPTNSKKVS
ncbi:hypothetical protein EVA_16067, partial [gut metagenome]